MAKPGARASWAAIQIGATHHFAPPEVISRARFRRLYPDAIPTRAEEFEAWWAEGKRALSVIEQQLARGEYLVAGSYSIADICLFAYVHRAAEGGFDMAPYPAIAGWCRRIESRAAFIPLNQRPE